MNPRILHPLPGTVFLALITNAIPAQLTITRASVATTGTEANAACPTKTSMAASADGRFVAFLTTASNLVPGDTNGVDDVFVRDVVNGTTERVNVSTAGAQMGPDKYGRGCFDVSISGDGRYVTFSTAGTKLIAGEKGGGRRVDVYLRDRQAGTTQRISLSSSGGAPNGDSAYASISGNGRYVAFYSDSDNLVARDRNRTRDIFVRDLWTGTNVRASVDSAGREANDASLCAPNASLSADGRYVTFTSAASNLVAGDTNGLGDAFVHDLLTGTTERVSVTASGGQLASGTMFFTVSMSGNGRYVTWVSNEPALMPPGAPRQDPNNPNSAYWYQAFRRDRIAGTTECVSLDPNGSPAELGVGVGVVGSSADGSRIAFVSRSTNLVSGFPGTASGVFLRDCITGLVALVSQGPGGAWPNGIAFPWQLVVGPAGDVVVFGSDATNLVAGDTNGFTDVFVAR